MLAGIRRGQGRLHWRAAAERRPPVQSAVRSAAESTAQLVSAAGEELSARLGALAGLAADEVREAADELRPSTAGIRVNASGVRVAGSRPRRRKPYGLVFDHLFTHLDAERAHQLGFAAIRAAHRRPVAAAMRRSFAIHDAALRVNALGLDFPGPLGLAAGFDKDAEGVLALSSLGFSFIEVGTVTAQPQPGNPRPRLVRLVTDRALVNRMGFNNSGAQAVAARLATLQGRRSDVVIGVNIGKSKAVPDDGAVADYVASARLLAEHADYLVVNVSSPNTPGLRDLQSVARLRPILSAVGAAADEAAGRHVPLLVKIAPDLADADVLAVADLALELGLDGIVATNTTLSRRHLRARPAEVAAAGAGGLSGRPLAGRSLAVLRLLRGRVGDQLVLVSVGGVTTPDDAWTRIRAGATLVQGYSAFIYEGPGWARGIQAGLLYLAHRAGYARVQDAVGVEQRRASGLAAGSAATRVAVRLRVRPSEAAAQPEENPGGSPAGDPRQGEHEQGEHEQIEHVSGEHGQGVTGRLS